jgi:endonuclease-3
MPLDQAKAWLRQLPGIGPKSAGIILSFALGRPAMAIDTHIYRVCKRLGVIGPKVTAEKAHELLEAMVEPALVFQFHVSFINHGRRVCKAQRPRCAECVVARGCPSRSYFMDENSPPEPAVTLGSDGRAPTPAQIPHTLPAEDNQP